ncbi:MAG: hypothetical protein VCC36_00715 [Gammaproteobacteria bacterium]
MLAKPELRSWSHRWPRLAGLMSHALLLLLLPGDRQMERFD